MIETQLCPFLNPEAYRLVGACGHADHEIREQPEVYCDCLLPKGRLYALKGHTGTDDCCSDFCDECDLRACFGCGCHIYEGWDDDDDFRGFADPGGRSALRAATHERCIGHGCHIKVEPTWSWCPECGTKLNPRKHRCPSCGARGLLTDEDVALGYQCDGCADAAERDLERPDYWSDDEDEEDERA